MIPNFFYHPRMMSYDFGPQHPLKPIRLARTIELLRSIEPTLVCLDPGLADRADMRLVHDDSYLEVVECLSRGQRIPPEVKMSYGFGSVDTPAFLGMYEAALAYCGGTVRAAQAILSGEQLAFGIGGGLHHAMRDKASGFCVFDDPAIALSILKLRYSRLMYVDIDLHHGDGVQALFLDDPDVLTFSIHESGRTLYPGTGFVEETGAGGAVVNIPLDAHTTGDVWIWAFEEVFLSTLDWFKPDAIVLQMGCDAHLNDPLGHLRVRVQEWLRAVEVVRDAGLPIVAVGGGGYELANVPRMWAAAVLTLCGLEVPEVAPECIPVEWGVGRIFDPDLGESGMGRHSAEQVVDYWRSRRV
jgi:acetoin utilization protein AcuC